MKFGFLILNYNTFYETKRCIDSIMALSHGESTCDVVVVDNASTDGSPELLANEYSDNSSVQLIFNMKNEGFSRGNNIGYEALRGREDFIIVTNSDTEFVDPLFLTKVVNAYNEFAFDICGPDVFFVENCGFGNREYHQSPIGPLLVSEEYITNRIIKDKANQRRYLAGAEPLASQIRRTLPPLRHIVRRIRDRRMRPLETQTNVRLYGACIIASKQYLEAYEKMFEPETFLYAEEEILGIKLYADSRTTLYDPSLRVRHYVSTATKKQFGEGRDLNKQANRIGLDIEAAFVLKEFYDEKSGSCTRNGF